MRHALYILAISGLLAGCASSDGGLDTAYPNLSDVKERPDVALTPERTDELVEILNQERDDAQAFAALGFRQGPAPVPTSASTPASDPRPVASVPEVAPAAVPLEVVAEEAATVRRQPRALVEQDQVSPDALARSDNPEELLATEPEFK